MAEPVGHGYLYLLTRSIYAKEWCLKAQLHGLNYLITLEGALYNPVKLLLSQLPFLLASFIQLVDDIFSVVPNRKYCPVSYQTCVLLMESLQ